MSIAGYCLHFSFKDPDILIHNLQNDCTAILRWIKYNNVKANPDKFLAISFGRKGNKYWKHHNGTSNTTVCHANRTLIYEADEFLAEVYCLADRLKCHALHLGWGHGHRHDALQPIPSHVNPILILLPSRRE